MERILLRDWMQCIAIRELLLKKLKRRKQKKMVNEILAYYLLPLVLSLGYQEIDKQSIYRTIDLMAKREFIFYFMTTFFCSCC